MGKDRQAVLISCWIQLHIYCKDVSHVSFHRFSARILQTVSRFPCYHQLYSGTHRAAVYTMYTVYSLCDSVCVCVYVVTAKCRFV